MTTEKLQGTVAKVGNVSMLASSVIRWACTNGVQPFYAQVDLTPSDAGMLLEKPVVDIEVSRTGTDGKRQDFTVKDLYVLRRAPGPDPAIVRVVLADCRWLWSYGHLCRRYNWRRHIGHKRAKDPASAPELLDVLPDVYFAKWSLKDGQPYRGDEVLEEILEEIRKLESYVGISRPISIDHTIRGKLADYPIDNLQIDDTADQALARVLSYLPQAGCTIDLDGTIRIYSRASGGEEGVLDTIGPPVVDEGTTLPVYQARLRPSEVHVLFTREIEVRFDHIELSGGYGTERSEDDRYLENVLSIPDWTLQVGNRVLPQGSWITVNEALASWPAPASGIALSHSVIQRGLVPYFDVWNGFGLLGLATPDQDWAGRVSAIQHHYRTTYRINPNWLERTYSVRAYRHATIDPETGTRAPAIAYSNFCYLGSQRSMAYQSKLSQEESYANNILGRPGEGALDPITREWHPAPARVSVVDEDQGIVHLSYQIDPTRMYEMILPAMVEIEGRGATAGSRPAVPGPGGVIRNASSFIAWDAVNDVDRSAVPKLSSGHAVTTILTLVPGVPNDDRQLHRVVRRPSDVEALVPGKHIPEALGPVMEVRVGGAFETARIVWRDDDRKEIEKAFGFHGPGEPNLEHLCVNQGSSAEGASLDAISDAVAARVYAMFQDRTQGGKTGDLVPVGMAGWAEQILHELRPSGEAFTSIDLPEQLPTLNLMSLLDSTARAMLLKLPQPGRGS